MNGLQMACKWLMIAQFEWLSSDLRRLKRDVVARATENTNTTPNALFLAREDGGSVVYGLNYDSKCLGARDLRPFGGFEA